MYFEQFYLGCLAHASYLLASEGEAIGGFDAWQQAKLPSVSPKPVGA